MKILGAVLVGAAAVLGMAAFSVIEEERGPAVGVAAWLFMLGIEFSIK